jgi:hypothetical protein
MIARGRHAAGPAVSFGHHSARTTMDEKQLQKLIRKNLETSGHGKKKPPVKQYDSTLTNHEVENVDNDRDKFFDEMKRREF